MQEDLGYEMSLDIVELNVEPVPNDDDKLMHSKMMIYES